MRMGATQSLVLEIIDDHDFAGKVAVADGLTDRSFTFREVVDYSRQLAQGLIKKCGFERGKVVAVYAPNLPEWNIVIHATLAIGGVFTACSPFLTPDELVFQLQDSRAQVLFTVPPFVEQAQIAAEKSKVKHVYVFGGCVGAKPFGSLLQNDGINEIPDLEEFSDNDVALYCYSPAGGGELKRESATHTDIISTFVQGLDGDEAGEKDNRVFSPRLDGEIMLAALPFWRTEGLVGVLLYGNYTGSPVYVHHRFHPKEILKSVQRHSITCLPLSLPMLEMIAVASINDAPTDGPISQHSAEDGHAQSLPFRIVVVFDDKEDDEDELDERLVDGACRFFGVKSEAVESVEILAQLTDAVDPEIMDYPKVRHGRVADAGFKDFYMQSSFFQHRGEVDQGGEGNLSVALNVVGWEGDMATLAKTISNSSAIDADSGPVEASVHSNGMMVDASGSWRDVFNSLMRAHIDAHHAPHAQTGSNQPEFMVQERVVKATFNVFSKIVPGKPLKRSLRKIPPRPPPCPATTVPSATPTQMAESTEDWARLEMMKQTLESSNGKLESVHREVTGVRNEIATETRKLKEEKTKLAALRMELEEVKQQQKDFEKEIAMRKGSRNEAFTTPAKTVAESGTQKGVDGLGGGRGLRTGRGVIASEEEDDDEGSDGFNEELRNDMILLMRTGREHVTSHNFLKALPLFEEAIELAEELSDETAEAKARGNLATIFESTGQHHKAIENYLTCLNLLLKLKDIKQQASITYNLSFSYLSLERFDEAIDFLSQSLELATQIGYAPIIDGAEKQLRVVQQKMMAATTLDSSDDNASDGGSEVNFSM